MSEAILETTPSLPKSDQNLVWLDCEMTGLDPEVERLIEIAIVVTGPNLEPRIEGPVLVIHQSDEQLAKMDKWNQNTHGRSGLIDKVKASTLDEEAATDAMLAFLKEHVPASKSPMCGNSICQDRRFMARYMPRLEQFFHYRNLDVSTVKELARRLFPSVYNCFNKESNHLALDDIRDSINELRYYGQNFFCRP